VFLSVVVVAVTKTASLRWLIYLGALSMLSALLLTALGLVRDLPRDTQAARELRGRYKTSEVTILTSISPGTRP